MWYENKICSGTSVLSFTRCCYQQIYILVDKVVPQDVRLYDNMTAHSIHQS